MAKRGGYPGGMGMPGNMSNLMKQAQRMQRQMEESQKALEEATYTAKAGGGAVEVIQNFHSYRRDMSGLMKTSLKTAELSVSPEGELVIGIPDGYESDYFTRFPENIQALEDFFEDAVAKHVNVKIVPISQQSEFEKQYPDTSELIRMDLLEEGMEEEL